MATQVKCWKCDSTLYPRQGATTVRCYLCESAVRVPVNPTATHQQLPLQQPQQRPSRPHPAPSLREPKKAVIIGISYKGTKTSELKGCINDAKLMKQLLLSRFNFPDSSIRMLTDEGTNPSSSPTKGNIMAAMSWLLQGCQAGDSLVFHFSGHGSQREHDHTEDEFDDCDETLIPVDFATQGVIVDNDINKTMVWPLPRGVKLHAIIDSCHSGTALDLPYLCRMKSNGQFVWEDHSPTSGARKGTNGGEAISFSGCDDHQKSGDSQFLAKGTSTGLMTYGFVHAIMKGRGSTYGSILNSMRNTILKHDNVLGRKGIHRPEQEPQLTSNEPFDVHTKPFSM